MAMLELIQLPKQALTYRLWEGPGDEVTLQLIMVGADADGVRYTVTDLISMCQWRFIVCDKGPVVTEIPFPSVPYCIDLDVSATPRCYEGVDKGKYQYAVLFLMEMIKVLRHLTPKPVPYGKMYVPDVRDYGWTIIYESLMKQRLITTDMALQIAGRNIVVSKDNRTTKAIAKTDGYDLYLKRTSGIYEAVSTYEFLTK